MGERRPDFVNGATDETTLSIFWSPASPGSISVVTFLALAKIPYKSFEMRGHGAEEENRVDPRFWSMNPDRTLPALLDGDFVLATPVSILRFLVVSRGIEEQWFSKNIKKRGRMNSALDWSLFVLRKAGKELLLAIELDRPRLVDEYWGTNYGPGGAHAGKPNGLLSAIGRLESLWLSRRDFAAGRRHPTIVDLTLWADFSFLYVVFHLESVVTAEKYPKLFNWHGRMRDALAGPYLQAWDAALTARAEKVPPPPPCPDNLDLPWKDYK